MDATLLVVRAGLDDSLSDDGRRGLDGLAQVGGGQCRCGPGIIRFSTGFECRMVSAFFWTEKSVGRFAGYCPFMGGDSRNAPVILEDLSACRIADGALLAMGEFRHNAQFCHLEVEPVSRGNLFFTNSAEKTGPGQKRISDGVRA